MRCYFTLRESIRNVSVKILNKSEVEHWS